MGNEQSQESSAPPKPEEAEREWARNNQGRLLSCGLPGTAETDLSDISDDREPDEIEESTITVQPAEVVKPVEEKAQKKKKKKKRKGRKSRTGDSEGSDGVSASAYLVSQVVPTQEEIELLREREPEAFDVYATSDVSEGEGGETDANVVAEDTTSADADDEEAIEASPAAADADDEEAVEGSTADADDEKTTEEVPADADDDEAIEETPPDINGPLTKAEDTPAFEVLVSQMVSNVQPETLPDKENDPDIKRSAQIHSSMSVPEPQFNSEGRYLCPFADTYDCKESFAKRKTAVRHASIHTASYVCLVCDKKLSRPDTLRTHMAKHTAMDIASAEARRRPGQEADTEERHAPLNNDTADGPLEAESPGFRTPPETSQVVPITSEVVARPRPGSLPEAGGEEHGIHVTATPEVNDSNQNPNHNDSDGPKNDMEEDKEEISRVPYPDTASDVQSPSPPSVFEEAEEPVADKEPVPANGLKRKRGSLGAAPTSTPAFQKPAKRRKRIQQSPPTSAQSRDEVARSESPAIATAMKTARGKQVTEKIIPTLQKGRQGTIDGWARSNSANSQSPGPVSNTQHVEVVVPLSSQAGPSGGFTSVNRSKPERGSDASSNKRARPNGLDAFALKKARLGAYTTPKGKKRAEPGVDYQSPATNRPVEDKESEGSDAEHMHGEIATSVAKRTFPGGQSRRGGTQDEDSDSALDDDEKGLHSEARRSKTRASHDSVEDKPFECRKCHFRFKTEDGLKKHLKKPNVHMHLYKCDECSQRFWNTSLLARHEKDTGHGNGDGLQGRTGPFDENEVVALRNWRDSFCEDHNITTEQFNDMMTDSMKRGNGAKWNWPFVTRTNFLKEYLDVLPGRNKRSMLRYRERNFQNLEGSRNWTEEDDQELIRLYKQFGSKWSEIAKRLTRTTDAVSQRWRHKLQYRDGVKGEWTTGEVTKFSKALEQVRRASGPAANSEDWHIPWNKISEKVGTRTPQQCSNHYRAIHGIKQGGRWVKVEGLEKTPGSSRILTPSKMERRLRGENMESSGRKEPISAETVEDNDEIEDEEASDEDVEDEEEQSSPAEDENLTDSASRLPRNPMNSRTPSRTLQLSQLFNGTQANTSALRRSPETIRHAPSQELPTPGIPIQRRALDKRSPLQEIKVKENGELDVEEEEEDEDGDDEDDTDGDEQQDDPPDDANTASAGAGADDEVEDDSHYEEAVERDAGSVDDNDEEEERQQQDGDTTGTSNDFLNSIQESARRVRSSQLQLPARRGGLQQNPARSSRRKGWSLSPSESSGDE